MKGNKTRKKINNYIIYFDRPLGGGSSGKVFLCIDESTKIHLAAKIIQKSQYDNNSYMMEAVQQQLFIHRSLSHENIVAVVDIVQTANNYYIFMEYCQHGSLRSLIIKNNRLNEQDAVHCLRQICRAFKQMFQKGIMHRDLKPENIVIQQNKLKITDFGFAKALSSSRQLTRTVVGTPLYMSPQILSKKPYSSKCDIWSIGVIYYQLLFGKHPWNSNSMANLYQAIVFSAQVAFPPQIEVSQLSYDFIRKCLQIQENIRMSWLEIYEHPLLGSEFESIAFKWRQAYQTAAVKLNRLRETVQLQKLVGVFLRVKVVALNFPQFSAIIQSLVPDAKDAELGPMYELFDKDFNGLIDFEEFVGQLSNCSRQVLKHINKLLQTGHSYEKLSNENFYSNLVKQFKQNPQVCEFAFTLISNMKMIQQE